MNYAIGDIQGCYQQLTELLALFDFQPEHDTLWFAGDLVNRGPQSLEVLRFASSLPHSVVVLGNHDLHLLTLTLANDPPAETFEHTMQAILDAPDRESLLDWLRSQKLMHYDAELDVVMSHAGLYPGWNLETALQCAEQAQAMLQSDQLPDFLDTLFGDEPRTWDDQLEGFDRLRFIINAFTRMRYVEPDGKLVLDSHQKTDTMLPWYELRELSQPILFGHWAALEGKTDNPNAIALDTGCVWGGELSALRLEDRKWFRVKSNRQK